MLKIAERARDMAAGSLGTQHPAYAVALQNLGLYYDAIENDAAAADEFLAQARASLKENDLPLSYGLYWLGIFHDQVSHNDKRAAALLTDALAIQRRALGGDDPRLAETMIALAHAKGINEPAASIALMEEALRIQRSRLSATDPAVLDSERRLAVLQAIAGTPTP